MYNMDLLNGGHLGSQPAFPSHSFGGNKITLEQVDPSTFDEDSDEDEYGKSTKPGKKTKGRVKIKMEFIENKLRRYTTFSKRKTGIMKKAYELSTLTGTQVMLLVASETGHVYTFATRKLQPMITSDSGKALIQTCLNSPDPPPMGPGQQQAVEQRMNPTGFEETELTYAVDDENGKLISMENSNGSLKPVYTLSAPPSHTPPDNQHVVSQPVSSTPAPASSSTTYQVTQQPSSAVSVATLVQPSATSQPKTTTPQNNISVQIPGLPQGFILQPGTSFAIPVQTTSASPGSVSQQQTVYRIPAPTQQIISSTQMMQSELEPHNLRHNIPATHTINSMSSANAQPTMAPSVFMYQTPQGIVYAPATGPIQEKAVLNFQQPTTALQDTGGQSKGQQQQTAQQIITIPVPNSLTGSQHVLLSASDTGQLTDLSQPSSAKKARK